MLDQGNCSEGVVRLADGGFSQRGRVEQCRHGVSGSVCDLAWDDTDAYITCKGLGYPGSGIICVLIVYINNYIS